MPQKEALFECTGCGLYTRNLENHLERFHRLSTYAVKHTDRAGWVRVVQLERAEYIGKLA